MKNIKSVRWDITKHCNLRCCHCQASIYKDNNLSQDDLDCETIFKIIKELKDIGVNNIGLLGGEPLLKEEIVDILKFIKNQGIKTTINTNALLIDNFDIDELLSVTDSIIVSLDGTNQEEHEKLRGKDTYNTTVANIKKLMKYRKNTNISISYVLNKFNINSITEIPRIVDFLGVDSISVDVVHKTGDADLNWNDIGLSDEEIYFNTKKLARVLDKTKDIKIVLRYVTNRVRDEVFKEIGIRLEDKIVCEAPGKTSIFISNNGIILPSQFFAYAESAFKNKKCDVKTYKVEDILKNDEFESFNQLYRKELYLNYYKPCNTCKYSGKQCNPSPISFLLGKDNPVSLCMYVSELDNNTINNKLKFSTV